MRYYVFMPLFALLFIVFQTTILDFVFLGRIKLEISLLLVIYAGFYLDYVKGGMLALTVGFFYDCIGSMIPGLFIFLYMVVFFISKNVSYRVYSEGITFLMFFTFLCALAEGTILFLIYQVLFGIDISFDILNTYVPQSLAIAVIGPAFFALFSRLEVLIYDEKEK